MMLCSPENPEAVYHIADLYDTLGNTMEAIKWFNILITLVPTDPGILARLGAIYDKQDDRSQVRFIYLFINKCCVALLVPYVRHCLPILILLHFDILLYQAFHYHNESYRHYPANINVISWLGVWHVKEDRYEKAVEFFKRAAQIMPQEVRHFCLVCSLIFLPLLPPRLLSPLTHTHTPSLFPPLSTLTQEKWQLMVASCYRRNGSAAAAQAHARIRRI